LGRGYTGPIRLAAAYAGVHAKRHNEHHERSAHVTAARIEYAMAVADLSEYTAQALKDGHANGGLDKLLKNKRNAQQKLQAELLKYMSHDRASPG